MAALDFPASPSNGQQFTGAGGIVWMWDGAKWVTQGVGGTLYLPLAGGQLTGPVGAVPGSPPNAALFFGSGNTNTGLYGNATLVGIMSGGQARFTVDGTASFSQGPLTLGAGAPTAPTHAATKAYVDGKFPVPLTTGVTGTLPLANGGTNGTDAATARTNLGAVAKTGDTMTGRLTVAYADDAQGQALFAGSTKAFRIITSAASVAVSAVDYPVTTFMPLGIRGSTLTLDGPIINRVIFGNGASNSAIINEPTPGNPSHAFYVTPGNGTGPVVAISSVAGWAGTTDYLQVQNQGIRTAGVANTGAVFGTGAYVNIASFADMKTDVQSIPGAVDIVKGLKPVSYTFLPSGKTQHGFIIEDLVTAYPEAVAFNSEGEAEGYGTEPIVATLTAVMQDALRRIEVLEGGTPAP